MSLNKINKITGDKTLVAGGTLFADNPIGTILPYGGTEAPRGWFLCQGQEISRTTYKDLFDIIGTAFGSGDDSTTFNLPDFRESVPVGSGTRGSGVTDHDTYTVGEFKDDQLQNHTHNLYTQRSGAAAREGLGTNSYTVADQRSGEISSGARTGTTTHGKQLGVNYIIKALMIGIPIDFAGSILLDELGNVNIDDQTLSNGQALVYDSTTGKWVNGESVDDKADKVANATNGNFAGLDTNGNLTDSGVKAADVLHTVSPITSATDFNTLTDFGTYLISSGSYVVNGPVVQAGTLVVYRTPGAGSVRYYTQKYYTNSTSDCYYRISTNTGDTWGSWQKIITDGNINSQLYLPYKWSLAYNANAAPTNQYVLLYERTANIASFSDPIHLKGIFSRFSGTARSTFDVEIDFRNATTAPVIRGYISHDVTSYVDIIATYDSTNNIARVYGQIKAGYSSIIGESNCQSTGNTMTQAVASPSGDKVTKLSDSLGSAVFTLSTIAAIPSSASSSNKLVTESDIDNILGNIQTVLDSI